MDFDPTVLSLPDVLERFWSSHDPLAAPRQRQYRRALFWRDEEQRSLAEQRREGLAEVHGSERVTTELLEFDGFHLAEGYHQKYRLRRHRELECALLETYPELEDFVNSTAAARLNGYLGGHGTPEALASDLPRLGLDAEAQARLLALAHLSDG